MKKALIIPAILTIGVIGVIGVVYGVAKYATYRIDKDLDWDEVLNIQR